MTNKSFLDLSQSESMIKLKMKHNKLSNSAFVNRRLVDNSNLNSSEVYN
jgi:hypothetical protein